MEKVDLFPILKGLSSVSKVSNLYPLDEDQKLDFIFYVCPRMTGNGLRLNRYKTGFTASYRDGVSNYSVSRFERVAEFIKQIQPTGIKFSLTTIFASADSFLLFPVPAEKPSLPSPEYIPDGFKLISNYEIYLKYLHDFGQMYQNQIWSNLPKRALATERERLMEILPSSAPDTLKEDFTDRCFAGFALDGLILSQGVFGTNPIILGVESSGVSIIQNATLPREKRLPVIDLN